MAFHGKKYYVSLSRTYNRFPVAKMIDVFLDFQKGVGVSRSFYTQVNKVMNKFDIYEEMLFFIKNCFTERWIINFLRFLLGLLLGEHEIKKLGHDNSRGSKRTLLAYNDVRKAPNDWVENQSNQQGFCSLLLCSFNCRIEFRVWLQ